MRIRKPCAAQTAGLGNIFSQKNNKGEENETMKKILALVLVLIMALGLAACAAPAAPAEEPTPAAEPETEKVDSQAILAELKTPAEESNWERTTSSQEVIDFLKVVAEHSAGRIILDTTTFATEAGTPISYMIISDVAPASPADVPEDKGVVYVNCNIHSGEIEGKESMMIFAREVAQGKHDDLLKDLVVIIVPNSNPDGNDNLGKNRITTQFTPKLVGTRAEGNGLNVNRDMTKLETACGRTIVKLMNDWNPILFIDAHATDGS